MLEHTFIHIPGIGPRTERRLWQRGVLTWQEFLDHAGAVVSPGRDRFISREIEASLAHREDISFFSERLCPGEMWRLFQAFKNRAVYLDIETSGGYQGVDDITVIGIYDGADVQTFVNGINLDDFEVAIAAYDLVITSTAHASISPSFEADSPASRFPRPISTSGSF